MAGTGVVSAFINAPSTATIKSGLQRQIDTY